MLKSYFLTAFRSLIRNKEYSLINILGLAVSISSCLLLFYTLRYELSFDNFHANKKRIFRVVIETHYPDGVDHDDGIPAPFRRPCGAIFHNSNRWVLYSVFPTARWT